MMRRTTERAVSTRGTPDDLRVRRTRRLLAQALVELAQEQPFESITARDVTERAEIGYATFFRHYSSPADLLRSVVDELLRDLHDLLPPLTGDHPERTGTLIFQHAREHADLYRLLFRADRSLELITHAFDSGMASIQEVYEAKRDSSVPFEIAAHHIIRSFASLIEWWLDQAMPYTPEEMGVIYRDLILRPTERVALQPRT